MSKIVQGMLLESVTSVKEARALLEKLLEMTGARAVFGEPIQSGDYTVITASEMNVGMGLGYGYGIGPADEAAATESAEAEAAEPMGEGGGGGGGGGGAGRAIAAIIIGPEGVCVEPIVDVTKVSLAFFTMFGSVLVMLLKMHQAGKRR